MAETTRTFVAVAVPEEKADKLGRLQSLIAPAIPGARWVEPRHFHVTLAFLGEVRNTELNGVCRAVAEATADFAPLELRLEALGVFPNPKRPSTIWVGLSGSGVDVLHSIQRSLSRTLRASGYPMADENRFSPHVTIGRLKPGRRRVPSPDVEPTLRHYAGWSAGSFRVAEVITFASNPTPEGPSYTPLARARLAAENDEPVS
jgi:2'-5' RNA ligase